MIKLNFLNIPRSSGGTLGDAFGISRARVNEIGFIVANVSADFVEKRVDDHFSSVDIAREITEKVAPISNEELAFLYYSIYTITQQIFKLRIERKLRRATTGDLPDAFDLLKN